MALLTYSLIVLTTGVLYLLACDPLAPCAGKVTEWLRGSAPLRSGVSTPEEAPLTRGGLTRALVA
jgi:hypothetical protein